MAKMIWLEGLDDELIQLNRSFTLTLLKPTKYGTSGEWAVSAYYDMKKVTYLDPVLKSREEAVAKMWDLKRELDIAAS